MIALSWALGNLNSFLSFGVCAKSGEPSGIDIYLLVLSERHTSLATFYLSPLLFQPTSALLSYFFCPTAGFIPFLNQAKFLLSAIVKASAMLSSWAWEKQHIIDIWLDDDFQLELV